MAWLLTWVWQGLAIVLAVWLLLRAAHRLNASTRHVVWWTTLAVVLALPLLPVFVGLLRSAPQTLASPGAAIGPEPAVARFVVPAVPDWALSILIGGWLGLVLLRLAGIARSFAHLRRIKRRCQPMPAEREAQLIGWRAARDARRRTVLTISDDVILPSVVGLGRPVIALPRDLLDDLGAEDLDRIALHELAHVVRRDDWTRLAQAAIESVAGLHPAVWVIGRLIDLEREAACDDFVVSRTGETKRYASCLATAAGRAAIGGRGAAAAEVLAPGASRTGRILAVRVQRLLDHRQGRRPWSLPAALATSAGAALVAVVTVGLLSAAIVLVDAAPDSPRAPMTLASRALLGSSSGIVPGVATRPVAFREQAAAPRRAEDPRLRFGSGLAGSFESWPGVSVVTPPAVTLPAEPPAPVEPVLAATPMGERLGDRPVALPDVADRGALDGAADRSPWQHMAGAGAAIGSGVKSASVATAGFFARAGTSIARAF